MVVAENMLLSTDQDQRAKRAAAAVTVRQIFRPTARRAKLNRRRLFRGMTYATTPMTVTGRWSTHRAKFIRQVHL